jgi:hypothetical protein
MFSPLARIGAPCADDVDILASFGVRNNQDSTT